MVTINSGREYTGIELNDWIKKINSVAPVEIFLTRLIWMEQEKVMIKI